MNAREFLFARLTGACIPENQVNEMIDDLLHEEAERVRRELSPSEHPAFLSKWAKGLSHAADLIDPEVEK